MIYHEISKIWRVSIFLLVVRKNNLKPKVSPHSNYDIGYLTAQQNTEVIERLKNKEYGNLDELVTDLEQGFGVIYSGSQKSEVCPMPYALFPRVPHMRARKAI